MISATLRSSGRSRVLSFGWVACGVSCGLALFSPTRWRSLAKASRKRQLHFHQGEGREGLTKDEVVQNHENKVKKRDLVHLGLLNSDDPGLEDVHLTRQSVRPSLKAFVVLPSYDMLLVA
jgi:hypothetical protein